MSVPGKRSTDRINVLNIVLMLVSAVLAFLSPFYLFLVAYAVLGPLHYLTEISWLHDRQYYTGRKYDYLFLVFVAILNSLGLFVHRDITQVLANVVWIAFIGSMVFATTKQFAWRAAVVLMAVALTYLVPITLTTIVITMLLLTLLHVFVFTGFFIAFGALKSKSVSGYISLGVFFIIAILLLWYQPMPSSGLADEFVIRHYGKFFGDLNIWLLRTLGFSAYAQDPFEFSSGAVAVMRFIAFAYLYHYLNWFSKTKIIRWHEVSKVRMATVVFCWLAAAVLYVIDYDLGFKALFFLSALHVVLEFPLDVRTVAGIGTELSKRLKQKKLPRVSLVR